MRALTAAASLALLFAGVASPAQQTLTSVYVDLPAARCVASADLILTVDDLPVAIARTAAGPHRVSAVVVLDTSSSLPPLDVADIAKRISRIATPGDTFRLATFGPTVLISTTLLTSDDGARRAVREVAQTKDPLRASPMWDAIYDSVFARAGEQPHVVIVISDARATGNDHGYADVYDAVMDSGTVLLAVGFGDEALPGGSAMIAVGRNDALRKLAADSAGGYTEFTRPRATTPPYAFFAEGVQKVRERCRLDFVPPIRTGLPQRLAVTLSGRAVRAPLRVPRR